jgi:hypothetical protein
MISLVKNELSQKVTSHQRINPPLACMESGSLPTGHCALCLHHAESLYGSAWQLHVWVSLCAKDRRRHSFPFPHYGEIFLNFSKGYGSHFPC